MKMLAFALIALVLMTSLSYAMFWQRTYNVDVTYATFKPKMWGNGFGFNVFHSSFRPQFGGGMFSFRLNFVDP